MSVPLFDALQHIGDRLVCSQRQLLCLNFDGTLAPFADGPQRALLSPQMERVLLSLANHDTVSMAIFSGRDRADLQSRVMIPNAIYAGNHGLEIAGPGLLFVEPEAAAQSGKLQELADDLTDKLQAIEGAAVERGGLMVSVNYGQVPPSLLAAVRRAVHVALVSSGGHFELTVGNMAIEIRPRVHWKKAQAVRWIETQLAPANLLTIYIGNHPTDEYAFAALPGGVTVKVGDEAGTGATYRVEAAVQVRTFLEWIDELLRPAAVACRSARPIRGHAGRRSAVAVGDPRSDS